MNKKTPQKKKSRAVNKNIDEEIIKGALKKIPEINRQLADITKNSISLQKNASASIAAIQEAHKNINLPSLSNLLPPAIVDIAAQNLDYLKKQMSNLAKAVTEGQNKLTLQIHTKKDAHKGHLFLRALHRGGCANYDERVLREPCPQLQLLINMLWFVFYDTVHHLAIFFVLRAK